MEEKKNGSAVGGFVLGLISFLLGGIPGVAIATLVTSIVGIVMSAKGIKKANLGEGKKALAIVGLILSIIGIFVSFTGIACTAVACTGGLASILAVLTETFFYY